MDNFDDIIDEPIVQPTNAVYANFGQRLLAYIIDALVTGIPLYFLTSLFGLGLDPEALAAGDTSGIFTYYAITLIVPWLYFAFMETSDNQATFGKMALGLKVTDLQGGKISFGKASGRYWGKMISAIILLIGYLMAIWTQKKQALHDIMAGCLVVKKA